MDAIRSLGHPLAPQPRSKVEPPQPDQTQDSVQVGSGLCPFPPQRERPAALGHHEVSAAPEQPIVLPAIVRAANAAAASATAAMVPGPAAHGVRIVMSGPPGAGKSTHGLRLAKDLGVPHISMGNLLRDEVKRGTEIGKQIAPLLGKGELVAPEIVATVLAGRLGEPDMAEGFVLDGYPRRMQDVGGLDAFISKNGLAPIPMLELEVPEDEVLRRVEHRRICQNGHPVDVRANPPMTLEHCDQDGTPLERRPDDKPETVHHRFEVYAKETQPVLDEYDRRGLLVRVDGVGSIDDVYNRVRLAADIAIARPGV